MAPEVATITGSSTTNGGPWRSSASATAWITSRVRQHAELDRADPEIIEAGIDLRAQEVDRRHVHGGDAARVLRGQRGDRAQAVHAMRGEGLEVGLDAGAAAGVGAGDGQGAEGSAGHGGVRDRECLGSSPTLQRPKGQQYHIGMVMFHISVPMSESGKRAMITAPQMRAARALLGMDQRTLAQRAGLSVPTIQRMEASTEQVRGTVDSLVKVVAALDAAGVELIGEGAASQADGRGVRLKATSGRAGA